ncbi:conjugative transposon protein TraM [Gramella sp. GC03-9]|uniref:Conjugative transposon protein TraM n=1 Tax=Christiangramia oceanisediminis TaxID=2920386 RepID=A0A9X2KYI4_9FLAO|nr:conjugative transposon protein TraM [Gramella oceanisediminis]MCP9200579.1 conjugative transposon protein TraM [Gramella oceanisediminis]
MKIEKSKIVFASVLAVVVLFIVAYSFTIMSDNDNDNEKDNLRQTTVPEIGKEQEEYSSKLDAINALKEVKETNAPSIYDESLIDSAGFYDPDLIDKEKQRIVDSIYNSGRIRYSENPYRGEASAIIQKNKAEIDSILPKVSTVTSSKEIGLEHQLFFSSNPSENSELGSSDTDNMIYAEVDGTQVVKQNYRLRMRLSEDARINGMLVPKNTPVFGFISFQPNRALIDIENINHKPVKLKAYDLQDGSEGIYVENSLRADATQEVIDDLVQDINITGVPQVSGIKKVFQRDNRNIKVTVTNTYKLILKAPGY